MLSISKINFCSRIYLLIILSFLLYNCNEKKEYKYVEKIQNFDNREFSYKTHSFYTSNDTLAYIEAFRKFKGSLNVSNSTKNKLRDKYTTPVNFSLFQNESEISSIDFKSKNLQKERIDKEFAKLFGTRLKKLSSDEIIKLQNQFDYKELDKNTKLFIQRDSDLDKENSLYGYIIVQDDYLKSFRLKFSSVVDEFTLPNEGKVIINGERYEINSQNFNGSLIKNREGFDEDISNNLKLLSALSNANFIEIEMRGRVKNVNQKISDRHISKLKETVLLYLELRNSM